MGVNFNLKNILFFKDRKRRRRQTIFVNAFNVFRDSSTVQNSLASFRWGHGELFWRNMKIKVDF